MSFAQRFIGAETLPPRMAEVDVQEFFRLSKDDICAVCERFRDDRRVAAASNCSSCGQAAARWIDLPGYRRSCCVLCAKRWDRRA